jgi:OOP family OmpA-OmpF porin
MLLRRSLTPTLTLALCLVSPLAFAGEPPQDGAKADGKRSGGGDRADIPWIKRWAPERNMVELGLFGGAFFPNKRHELFDADTSLPQQGYQRLNNVGLEVGGRVGYYPLRLLGIEAEGGVMPTMKAGGERATMYTVRGGAVLQLPFWSVVPFATIGGGMLGVSSDRAALGNDIDPALHVGGGVKVFLNRWIGLRLDVRDVISHKQGVDATFKASNLEILLGLTIALNRKKDEKKPEPKPAPVDTDGDGFFDDVDACVNEAETVNDYKDDDGCPEKDTDGDGFWDDQDACVDVAGVAPDGCPPPDTDGDGILDKDDQCIEQPETKNNYQDTDGCPDEIPQEISKFSGVIEGIYFDTGKDTIKKSSFKILNNAVDVLTKFPDVKIKINGHTDNQGKPENNMDLSRRRAESVKNYFVGKGIAEDRIKTEGFGQDKPIEDNGTKAGRAKNRRIEFELVQ